MDISKATSFVNASGGEFERAFLGVLDGGMMPVLFESMLLEYQLEDGSWYYRDDEARMPSVGATIYWLRTLIDARMQGTVVVSETVNFLVANQGNDGSFFELPLKLKYSPQPWLSNDEEADKLFFTTGAAAMLVATGNIGNEALNWSVDFIESEWKRLGEFPYYPHSTAAALPIFAATRGRSSDIYEHSYRTILFNCESYPIPSLTYALDMCRFAGIPADNDLVRKLLQLITSKQRDDGGVDFDGATRALVTVDAINLANWYVG